MLRQYWWGSIINDVTQILTFSDYNSFFAGKKSPFEVICECSQHLDFLCDTPLQSVKTCCGNNVYLLLSMSVVRCSCRCMKNTCNCRQRLRLEVRATLRLESHHGTMTSCSPSSTGRPQPSCTH